MPTRRRKKTTAKKTTVQKKTTTRGSSRKKSGVINIPFKGVQRYSLIPEGLVTVVVDKVEQKEASTGNPMLSWEFLTDCPDEPKYDKQRIFENTVLTEKALWKLADLLEALTGETVSDEEDMSLKLTDMVGLRMVAEIQHRTFEGRKRAEIVDYLSEAEAEAEEGEDEDVEVVEGDELEEDPEIEEEEELEELDLYTVSEIQELNAKELGKLVKEYELDVDLSKKKTVRGKRSAVIAAMEEADYLAEEEEE